MTIQCTVQAIEPLASHTYRILLHPEQPVAFKAGQYLMVVMGEKDKRPFSIASSPCRHQGELELHIGASEQNAYALEVVEAMQAAFDSGSSIEIDAPHGDAWIREDSESNILLIAGGTGFSYVRSILDHCIAQNITRPVYLYWGAKAHEQLYAYSELKAIADQNDHVHFIPVLENITDDWKGEHGNVLQAVERNFESLENFDIYIAGRFEMAGAARDLFTQNKEARRDHLYADAYAFI